MNKEIKIQGEKYPIKFGYGAFRILGNKWKCSGVQAVAKQFQNIFPEGGSDDIEFEQGDMIGDLVLAGMENAGVDSTPEKDDIINEVLFDSDKLNVVMQAFADSFPKPGNPQPRKKTGKGKK